MTKQQNLYPDIPVFPENVLQPDFLFFGWSALNYTLPMALMKSLKYARRDPYLMLLGLAMGASVLIFFFILILYLTRVGTPAWVDFRLPKVFWLSTLLLTGSSACMYMARKAFNREHYHLYPRWLVLALGLSIGFCVSQYSGWQALQTTGVLLTGGAGGAFVYILSGLHLAHIVGGMGILVWTLADAIRNLRYADAYVASLNPVKISRLNLLYVYWRFVDTLWLVLFFTFLFLHS